MYKDEETGEMIKNLLVGGAFTNRPFFKLMSPLMASEDEAARSQTDQDGQSATFLFSVSKPMKTIANILAAFHETGAISAEDQGTLKQKYSELSTEEREPRLIAQIESALEFSEESDDDAADEDSADDDDSSDDDSSEDDDASDDDSEEDSDEDDDADSDDEDEDDSDDDDSDEESDEDEEADDDSQEHSEKEVSVKASELTRLQNVEKELIKEKVSKKM